jgi:hypothetical protein
MIASVIKQGLLLETAVNEIEPFTLIGIRNNDSMPKFIKKNGAYKMYQKEPPAISSGFVYVSDG